MPYTVKELADHSGKTTRWIQYLCQTGVIPSKPFGNAYLIEDADAEAYLASIEEDKDAPETE